MVNTSTNYGPQGTRASTVIRIYVCPAGGAEPNPVNFGSAPGAPGVGVDIRGSHEPHEVVALPFYKRQK